MRRHWGTPTPCPPGTYMAFTRQVGTEFQHRKLWWEHVDMTACLIDLHWSWFCTPNLSHPFAFCQVQCQLCPKGFWCPRLRRFSDILRVSKIKPILMKKMMKSYVQQKDIRLNIREPLKKIIFWLETTTISRARIFAIARPIDGSYRHPKVLGPEWLSPLPVVVVGCVTNQAAGGRFQEKCYAKGGFTFFVSPIPGEWSNLTRIFLKWVGTTN